MRTIVSRSGKLSLSLTSRRHSKSRNKVRKRAGIVPTASTPTASTEGSENTEHTASIENVIHAHAEERPGITEALSDFPLKEKMVPSYSNKRDLKDIVKHRISYADVYNADMFLYLSIAQTLHVFIKSHDGVPVRWREDTLPVVYGETRIVREDGTSFITEMDQNFQERSQLYSQDLMRLRDEFIWIYDSSTGYDDDGEPIDDNEFTQRRDKAFADLSEIAPTLWT